jgi:EpsI family protein
VALAGPLAWLELRPETKFEGTAPDLANIIAEVPAGWRAKQSLTDAIDPRWNPDTQAAYDTVVMRQYARDDGAEVTLLITWSRDGRLRAGHQQEICYGMSGFVINTVQSRALHIRAHPIAATAFGARRGEFIEDVVYWRVTGGQLDDGSQILWKRLRELRIALSGSLPDNVMVRVSTRRRADAPPSNAIEAFVDAFMQPLPMNDFKTLTGTQTAS